MSRTGQIRIVLVPKTYDFLYLIMGTASKTPVFYSASLCLGTKSITCHFVIIFRYIPIHKNKYTAAASTTSKEI
jgi:hypothetical protein